jgi:hypothetical protein
MSDPTDAPTAGGNTASTNNLSSAPTTTAPGNANSATLPSSTGHAGITVDTNMEHDRASEPPPSPTDSERSLALNAKPKQGGHSKLPSYTNMKLQSDEILTDDNWGIWKTRILHLLGTNDLEGYPLGQVTRPHSHDTDAFRLWKRDDCHTLSQTLYPEHMLRACLMYHPL